MSLRKAVLYNCKYFSEYCIQELWFDLLYFLIGQIVLTKILQFINESQNVKLGELYKGLFPQ